MTRTAAHRSHPDRRTLAAFLAGTLPPDGDRRVEEHLRAACLPCLLGARSLVLETNGEFREALARGLLDSSAEGRSRQDLLERYSQRIERKAFLIVAEEQVVPALMSELMLRPPAARRESVRSSKRYQLLSLAEALRQESRSEGFRDVARAVELAELSTEVAECLDPEFYGRHLVADARGMAWAMAGNARRIAGDLFGAERALESGLGFLDGGTGSASEGAEALSLLASLRIDQSRFPDAIDLLEKVVATYRRLGEPGLEGRTLIKLGSAAGYSGKPLRAVEVLRPAIDLLTKAGDLHAAMLAKHNVAWSLAEAGEYKEAERYLAIIRSEYHRFPEDPSTQIRRRWLEGRIHEGLGELDEAMATLREVRSIFAEEERAFDNALVTLDLAAVYLQAGKTDEVKRLAEELYPVFRSHDVHRHAVAALILFKQAAATEAATVSLVRDLSRYLTRARNNPYLKYEPTEPVS